LRIQSVLTACLISGILGGAIPGRATESATTTVSTPFSEEIVVTASVDPSPRAEVPSVIDRIDRAEIDRRQATEIAQLLETSAGLAIARSGSPGHSTSLFSRGTNSNHTLVLWNGVPLNDAFDGRFDFAVLPTDGVDRVEVARGAYSALYGSALGAVIQVVTGGDPGGRLRLEAGEHALRRFSGSYGRQLGNGRFDLVGHSRRGEGELDNDFFDADGLALHSSWNATPALSIGLVARGQDSEIGVPRSGSTLTPHRRNQLDERQFGMPVSGLFGRWNLQALASRSQLDLAFRDPDAFFGSASDSTSTGTRLRASLTRETDWGWIAGGAEGLRDQVDYQDSFSAIPQAQRDNLAVFAQTRWAGALAGLDTTVEIGVRRDDNEGFGGHTSPRLAAAVERNGFRFHLSAGQSFRAPSFLELYYPFFGNPDLDPETSKSLEAGLGFRRAGFEISVVGYENRIRSLIQGVPPTFLADNVGRALTRGVEGSLLWRGALVDARLSASQGKAENRDTGEALARRPETMASAVVSFHPPRFTGTLTVVHVGERPDIDPDSFATRTNPAYTRVDLAVSRPLSSWFEPYARVENAADSTYEEVLGFPALGRTFTLGVALRLP
jgi:vitamin B12 transporter